jgi:hypothetical protein
MQQSYLRTEQFSWYGVDIFGWDVLYPNQLGNSPAGVGIFGCGEYYFGLDFYHANSLRADRSESAFLSYRLQFTSESSD